ncbi:MAG: SDR family oxidoreductase [Acetobacteraceae bacterium]|nr:SDR family oxidoreductase [Acetobacteraceae bacterium]
MIHLTKIAAAELARYAIRVNAICPGFILTDIFTAGSGVRGAAAEVVQSELARSALQAQPVRKPGSPRHVADASVFLASDEAEFITGTHLAVDGGITIGPRHSWDPDTPSPIDAARGERAARG